MLPKKHLQNTTPRVYLAFGVENQVMVSNFIVFLISEIKDDPPIIMSSQKLMGYLNLAHVLRKNMISSGVSMISALSHFQTSHLLFRAVVEETSCSLAVDSGCTPLPSIASSLSSCASSGWVGILGLPLPWETLGKPQIFGVLPSGYKWGFCQAPALQGSQTHVGSHF